MINESNKIVKGIRKQSLPLIYPFYTKISRFLLKISGKFKNKSNIGIIRLRLSKTKPQTSSKIGLQLKNPLRNRNTWKFSFN